MVENEELLDDADFEARQLLNGSFHTIALWCGGRVQQTVQEVGRHVTRRQYLALNEDDIAFAGDWIVKAFENFYVLKDDEYNALMELGAERKRKYREVYDAVTDAMLAQTRHTLAHDDTHMGEVARQITKRIIEIFNE